MADRVASHWRVGLLALLPLMLAIPAAAQDSGAEIYATSCAACHQGNGEGVPGAFPPLKGHAAEIATAAKGRDYLAHLVLFGLTGAITVEGKPFNGEMPAWGDTLSDAQLAAVLNYVLHSWGNDQSLPAGFASFAPSDIAAARASKLTPDQVYALRQQTAPAPSAPAVAQTPPAFTEDQADRGKAAYNRNCQDCHGRNLNDGEFGGPPLNGNYFAHHWGSGSLAALYSFMSTKMPPDRPGKLNPQTYADMTAYLLSQNGYQPGKDELPSDADALQGMTLKK